MNNISCEHCGCSINVESDKKCPNCGAPYKNNKQYKEYKEYLKKQKEANLESQKVNNEIKSNVFKTFKTMSFSVAIFSIFIFLVVIGVFFVIFKNILDFNKDFETDYPKQDDIEKYFPNKDDNEHTEKDDKLISVSFNETAYTDDYNMKVNKVIQYKDELFTNNKTYYAFNIIFKNKSDKWQTLNNIKLVYTDSEGDEQNASKGNVPTKILNVLASEKKTYEGYIYFDIPSYVKDVKIVYNNVQITIDNFKEKVK